MTVADMAGAEAVMAGEGMAIRVELQSILQGTTAAAAAMGASTRSARHDDLVLAKYAN